MKNKLNKIAIGVLSIIGVFALFIINGKFCIIPKSNVYYGEIENKKVCSTYVPYENNLIVFGGYNSTGSDSRIFIHYMDENKEEPIFKSNFNNSYGNYAAIFKNKKNENILINIQPIQFTGNSKYGIETYNFKTKELKILPISIKKRDKNENFRYLKDEQNIYILDDSNIAEVIELKEKVEYRKEKESLTNYGKTNGLTLGGLINGVAQKYTSLDIEPNEPLELIEAVKNPEIYPLKSSFWRDNSYLEFVIIDKSTADKFIQVLAFEDDSYVELVKMPYVINGAKYIDAVNLGDNELIIFFEKKNNIYLTRLSNLGVNLDIQVLGRYKSNVKNQKYVNIQNKIYQIGGIETNAPFTCKDAVKDDSKITGSIIWL